MERPAVADDAMRIEPVDKKRARHHTSTSKRESGYGVILFTKYTSALNQAISRVPETETETETETEKWFIVVVLASSTHDSSVLRVVATTRNVSTEESFPSPRTQLAQYVRY